jgi:acyl-coenzyme A thioesterase PaaI-like protein
MNPRVNAAMTPEQLAESTAQKMLESDACSRTLGLELVQVRPGYARMQMNIRADFPERARHLSWRPDLHAG